MEKRRRSECENDVPEAMIQHIQSLLSEKEAAQTTILSKSWYNAWLTRPNLVFSHRDFSNSKECSNISKKTIQRYRDLNLKIDSFKCQMPLRGHSLANELIAEAINLGATDISVETYQTMKFVLPGDVLRSKSLIRLSITACIMESTKVNCSMLKYLYLCGVFLEGDLFWDIISSCPLIEGLELRYCKFVLENKKIPLNLSKQNLFELHKLKTLLLEKVKLCSMFFRDFSSRFPCLKDLNVHKCSSCKELQIYSQSLEFISFVHLGMIFNADFDVPNLRKFCISGKNLLPSLSFPNSSNWESDVSISLSYNNHVSAKWSLNLNKFLTNLSMSKVSLNLQNSYLSNIDKTGNTACLPRPLVENLTIDLQYSKSATALLDSLFQWCRPVFVTMDPSFIDGKRGIESMEIFYSIFMQQRKSVDDLEEVSVQVFDEVVFGWRTITCKSLVDTEERIRFHLRWGQH